MWLPIRFPKTIGAFDTYGDIATGGTVTEGETIVVEDTEIFPVPLLLVLNLKGEMPLADSLPRCGVEEATLFASLPREAFCRPVINLEAFMRFEQHQFQPSHMPSVSPVMGMVKSQYHSIVGRRSWIPGVENRVYFYGS